MLAYTIVQDIAALLMVALIGGLCLGVVWLTTRKRD